VEKYASSENPSTAVHVGFVWSTPFSGSSANENQEAARKPAGRRQMCLKHQPSHAIAAGFRQSFGAKLRRHHRRLRRVDQGGGGRADPVGRESLHRQHDHQRGHIGPERLQRNLQQPNIAVAATKRGQLMILSYGSRSLRDHQGLCGSVCPVPKAKPNSLGSPQQGPKEFASFSHRFLGSRFHLHADFACPDETKSILNHPNSNDNTPQTEGGRPRARPRAQQFAPYARIEHGCGKGGGQIGYQP
jgi:hypothetical protein